MTRRRSPANRQRAIALAFVLPAALILVLVFAIPLAETIGYSLTNWRGGVRESSFIGLANYGEAVGSDRIMAALRHNLMLLLVIPIEVALAVFVASLLRERLPGWRIYRFLVFVPSMISITIVGYVWVYFLEPQGVVNVVLRFVGLGDLARVWLADPDLALICVMVVLIWRDTGFAAILFYSRLLGVDESIYESAALDGAKRWRRMRHIDLPLLTGTITVFVVLMTIWLFSFVFNYVYVMTGGGPGYASTVAEIEVFREAFQMSRMGYGAAVSVILLLVTLPILVVQVRLQLRRRSVA